MDTDTGPADYMLFIDGKACGILEAKREGTSLGDVVQQSHRYAVSHTKHTERWMENLPFTYEATNQEIRFCDWRDPYARSRTTDCIKWRFSNLIECPELFVHIINSQMIKGRILSRTKGVAQKKICLGTFKSVAFPLPPNDEQIEMIQQIDLKLSAADRLSDELDLYLAKTKKQSILVTAFSGKKTRDLI